jgi:archaeal flagellar protein FlaG
MSSETITTALFLISAVIAAGVLINAVYPVVYNMAGTFSSSTHESDVRMRTDFKIISAVAYTSGTATIWMKNIGSEQIAYEAIKRSDVFCGEVGKFDRIAYLPSSGTEGTWTFDSPDATGKYDLNGNNMWDPGETLKISVKTGLIPTTAGDKVYFQFALPTGVWRSTEFAASSAS